MRAKTAPSPSFAESNSSELLTPEQTAKKLNISRRCLGNWTRARVVPMVKIGRVCRFDFTKVKAALEKFEQVEITR